MTSRLLRHAGADGAIPKRRSRRLAVVLGALALACSRDDASARVQPSSTGVSVELPDGSRFTMAAPPRRVVPANTAAAEFACPLLGAERVAALPEQVDRYSELSFRERGFEKVPRFDRYHAEPLIALLPDLVLTHAWQAAETSEVLRAQGIPVLALASIESYDDIRAALVLLGRVFATEARSAEIVADLDARVGALKEGAQKRSSLRALVYSNDGTGGWAAGTRTTADALLRMCGLRNAAAQAGIEEHAALDLERLIEIDPDVFVVSAPATGEGGSATKHVLTSSSSLQGLRALREQRIIVLPASLISADSPLLVDAAEALAREVDRMLSGTAVDDEGR